MNPVIFVCMFRLLGPTLHIGGKPHAVFQGRDACQGFSRADVPPTVRPEEEEGLGPTL